MVVQYLLVQVQQAFCRRVAGPSVAPSVVRVRVQYDMEGYDQPFLRKRLIDYYRTIHFVSVQENSCGTIGRDIDQGK